MVKTQLINDIENVLPNSIYNEHFTYIEPFVGSGAVLFWMLNNFPNMQKAVINDINDNFFDDLYANFNIQRVEAKRSINANPESCYLGVPLSGRAFRCNLLLVPHKRIITSIPNAKLAT